MLKKLWKWNAKIGGKLVNVDPDASSHIPASLQSEIQFVLLQMGDYSEQKAHHSTIPRLFQIEVSLYLVYQFFVSVP